MKSSTSKLAKGDSVYEVQQHEPPSGEQRTIVVTRTIRKIGELLAVTEGPGGRRLHRFATRLSSPRWIPALHATPLAAVWRHVEDCKDELDSASRAMRDAGADYIAAAELLTETLNDPKGKGP